MVLRAVDLIQLPTRDKTTEYMRYSLRLKPFWGLSSPEILPFESYRDTFTIPNSNPIVRLFVTMFNVDSQSITASDGECVDCTTSD
jgi:hypothetical protein